MFATETLPALFKRAARDPNSLTDADWARLSDDDKAMLGRHFSTLASRIESLLRVRRGLEPLAEAGVSASRLAEICDAARRPDFLVSSIPLDEFELLQANPRQRAALDRAIESGLDEGTDG